MIRRVKPIIGEMRGGKLIPVTLIAILVMMVAAGCLPQVTADKCVIPGSEADIYNPGQKVIVAWNGTVEKLILSTDLYSSKETKVLEIIPLPSKPSVEKGSYKIFTEIQRIIYRHAPLAAGKKGEGRGPEIVFHERIGAHDITVVKAHGAEELINFLRDYASREGLESLKITERVKEIIEDYLRRGFNYWVLDLVEVGGKVRSIDPIIYTFRSDELYYPLKVSRAAKGETKIIVYAITRHGISGGSLPTGFKIAEYRGTGARLSFPLTRKELERIDPGVAEMFDGWAWFTATTYSGDLEDLEEDIEVKGKGCRFIEVLTSKPSYQLGEPVKITIHFVHLAPGCYEIQVVHHHEIRLEVFRDGELVKAWSWKTNKDLIKTVYWTPDKPGTYRIRASSWFNGERLETEAECVISVEVGGFTHVIGHLFEWIIYGIVAGVALVILGIGIGYLLGRRGAAKGSSQEP